MGLHRMILLSGVAIIMVTGCSDQPVLTETSTNDALTLPLYGIGSPAHSGKCGGPRYRQFDFWVGKWEVQDPDGNVVGTNVISSELNGCLVEENWIGASGGSGRSLNMFDRSTGEWNQAWIDQFAQHIRIAGGIEAGSMVMRGDRLSFFGTPITDQIAWTPLSQNEVRQFWQITVNVDPPFTIDVFDGRYMRRDKLDRAAPIVTEFCNTEEFDQLDFWVGPWHVSANGHPVGYSEVSEDQSNCLIEERFSATNGVISRRFMGYDNRPGEWYSHQIDNQGFRFALTGGETAGVMVLEGEGPSGEGRVDVRNTIASAGPDTVTQTVEFSTDGGQTWTTRFVLLYERASST